MVEVIASVSQVNQINNDLHRHLHFFRFTFGKHKRKRHQGIICDPAGSVFLI